MTLDRGEMVAILLAIYHIAPEGPEKAVEKTKGRGIYGNPPNLKMGSLERRPGSG